MKKIIVTIISYVLAIALLVGILARLTRVFELVDAKNAYTSFFDKNEEYDVLFVGSSKVIDGIYPMQLWDDYGITSYNIAGHGNQIPSAYWQLMNALDYKTPKLVVVDINFLNSEYKYWSPEYLHQWMDAFKLTPTKIRAIVDLMDDSAKDKPGVPEGYTKGEAFEFVWNFCKYHSRWTELEKKDWKVDPSMMKGAEIKLGLTSIEYVPDITDEITTDNYNGVIYLKKIIEECCDRNIEVVLINLPNETNGDTAPNVNKMWNIADEYNVRAVDLSDKCLVDYSTDFNDGVHLNMLGASKITEYLGEYLVTECGVVSHRGDQIEGLWDDDLKKYNDALSEMLQYEGGETLSKALMMLKSDNFESIISIRDAGVLADDVIVKLLEVNGVDIVEVQNVVDETGNCYVLVPARVYNSRTKNSLRGCIEKMSYTDRLDDELAKYIEECSITQDVYVGDDNYRFRIIAFNTVTGRMTVNNY